MRLTAILSLSLICSLSLAQAPVRPLALVYDGPGSCAGSGTMGCTGAAEYAAEQSGFEVKRVGPSALSATTTEADYQNLFQGASVWIQPGGSSRTFLTTATPELKAGITHFVHEGGGYVGFCAGAFSATEFDGALNILGLGIFPGKTYPYPNETVDMIFDDLVLHFNPDAYYNHVYPVNWGGAIRDLYFEEGARLRLSAADLQTVEVTATLKNGEPISARAPYGRGRVYLTGMHPEAPEGWRQNPDLPDADGVDYDLVQNMLRWASGINTFERILVATPYEAPATTLDGRYVGLSAHYETSSHKRRSRELVFEGSTSVKATSYDAVNDLYEIQMIHTSALGAVVTASGSLSSAEMDQFASDSVLTECEANYGVLSGDRCTHSSSNTVLTLGVTPYGLLKSESTASDGTVYITTLVH